MVRLVNAQWSSVSAAPLIGVLAIGGCSAEAPATPDMRLPLYDNPTGFTLLTSTSGTLTLEGRCLRVVGTGGPAYDLVWPSGTTWDGERQTVTWNDVEAQLGVTVTLGGSTTSGRGSEGARAWLSPPPPECISDHQWLVSGIVSVERPGDS